MESILDWTWPHEETFRFYLEQFFFWSGYYFIAGLVGTFPYRFTRYNHTAWTTFVLGAMGTLIAYLSQFFFHRSEPLDMTSPYAVIVATVATAVLAPLVSLFAFVCRPTYDDYDFDDYGRPYRDRDYVREGEYVDDEPPVVGPPGYGRRNGRRRRL